MRACNPLQTQYLHCYSTVVPPFRCGTTASNVYDLKYVMNYREPMRGSERENVGAHVAEGWAGYDVICIKNMN